jgi:hypothetical protein
MEMKRIGITVMIVGCTFALGAGTAAASSFSLCLRVDVKVTGTYEDAKCDKEKVKGEYVLVSVLKKLSVGVWCAKLDNGSTKGNFETEGCTTEVAEKGAYIEVKVTKEEEEKVEEEKERPVEFDPATGQSVSGASSAPDWENPLLWSVTCEKVHMGARSSTSMPPAG